ncbi:MAG: chorismate-binding protein [Flavobacteriales bacterium]|nr:chorismate-binding protein [Flavobacteriales bacterium]MDW8433119.1 chorismate-binding protein [Flavobacteriales bacterium]
MPEEALCVFGYEGQIFYLEGRSVPMPAPDATCFVCAPFKEAPQEIRYFAGKLQPGFPDRPLLRRYLEDLVITDAEERDTTSAQFKESVRKVQQAIQEQGLRKVVLSAVRTASWKLAPENLEALFLAQMARHSEGFVALLMARDLGIWSGASPELLLAFRQGTIYSMSLAGTRPVVEEEDSPPWNEKEIEEQDIVTRFIEEILIQAGVKGLRIEGPGTRRTGSLEHLCTVFSGAISPSMTPVEFLSLALKLHPTPAVCGMPRNMALQLLMELEKHSRRLYTGFWGFISPLESRLFVNIRCLRLSASALTVFAGAGITQASRPDDEWLEVRRKMRATLQAAQQVLNSGNHGG